MRVRAQNADGDMTFGQSAANFLVNSPSAVRQIVETRLKLWVGEWFLDTESGTPYNSQILGNNTQPLYDAAVVQRMLDTPGVIALINYQSDVDGATRVLSITATLDTQFGVTALIGNPPGTSGGAPEALPVFILNLPSQDILGGAILG